MSTLAYDIFDNFIDGIVIVDRNSKVLYLNSVLEQQTGQSLKRIQRSKPHFSDLFGIDLVTQISTCQESVPYEEFTLLVKPGTNIRLQISLKSISENEILLYIRDVTLEESLQRKYRAELDQKETVIQELKTARDQLKNYSENLEKIVQERTQEVQKLSHTQKALLDSLTQGFFLFRENGICDDVFSKSCLTLLGHNPGGKKVWESLSLAESESKAFQRWMKVAFSETLPFEDLAPLATPQLNLADGRTLSLEYFPMRREDSAIEALVVVVNDVTSLLAAQKQAVESKAQAQMIIELVKKPERTSQFFSDMDHQWEKMPTALKSQNQNELFRILHTLKACYATFEMRQLTNSVHLLEETLRPDLTVDWKKLTEEIESLQENHTSFINENSFLKTLLNQTSDNNAEEIHQWVQTLPLLFQKDYYRIQATQSFLKLIKPLEETAFQIAGQLNKEQPKIEFCGPDIRIPKNLFSNLVSNLVHAIRNTLDHGIESPEERSKAHKPTQSKISFRWFVKNSLFYFEISDDGSGIDVDRFRKKLDNKVETDDQLIQHVFDPQFSTKDSVSEFSGRGVGLDALRSACEELAGKIWIENFPGQGVTIKMEIPINEALIHFSNTQKAA